MPTAARRPCAAPGCRNLQPCEAHPRRDRTPSHTARLASEPWRALYKREAWQRLRRAVLADEPLCRTCAAEGRLVLAAVVDHIEPHRGNEQRFFDRRNMQPLCYSCHSRKTRDEAKARRDV